MLNKKISYDERIAQLSVEGQLLFSWCISHQDVKGRMYGDPRIIKGQVVPYIKQLTPARIEKELEHMASLGLIVLYGVARKYIQFNGFDKNQRIDINREAPSEIPTPDELQSLSSSTPQEVNTSKVNISKKKGKEIPPSFEDVSKYCKERKNGLNPKAFMDFYISKGWMVGKNKMKDWKAAVHTWEHRTPKPPQPPGMTRPVYKPPVKPDPKEQEKVAALISKTVGRMNA